MRGMREKYLLDGFVFLSWINKSPYLIILYKCYTGLAPGIKKKLN